MNPMSQPPPVPDYRSPASQKMPQGLTLTPEQLQAISQAKVRGKKLQRSIRVARTDAWIAAILAGGAILTSCGGIVQLLIGVFLAYIAFRSFRGAAGLKRLDRKAPTALAINQLVLASGAILYFAYQLWTLQTGHSAIIEEIRKQISLPGLSDMDDTINLVISIFKLAYASLILVTMVFQGLMARYYHSRLKIIDEYLTQTPQWLIDLQKAQAA